MLQRLKQGRASVYQAVDQALLNRLRQQEAAEHQAVADSQMPQAKSRRRLPSRLPSPVAREVTTPWPKRSCARRAGGERSTWVRTT